jgi:DNA integrity scanning protein DisA with diadenylate cyclase activity
MMTAIFTAILFFLVANLLDLNGIEWVFSNISQVAVIATIFIFQPEIRELLKRTAIIRRTEVGKYNEAFCQMLSEATLDMAPERQGAIIVLPGNDPIEEWQSGRYPKRSVCYRRSLKKRRLPPVLSQHRFIWKASPMTPGSFVKSTHRRRFSLLKNAGPMYR